MPVTLTEEYISLRLTEALEAADISLDGYSEVELTGVQRLKCAAVLVPLIWHENEWHLLYTRRTDRVESHKGQVSFPGGACDEVTLGDNVAAWRRNSRGRPPPAARTRLARNRRR